MLPALGSHARAVVPRHPTRSTVPATVAPLRGMPHTVEHGGELDFVSFARCDLQHLSEPAAELAVAAGVWAQFLAPDDDGAGVFGRLDRHGMDAGWEG